MFHIDRWSAVFSWLSHPRRIIGSLLTASALSFHPAIDAGLTLFAGPSDQRIPKVVHLSGSPYERGRRHGKELRQEIAKMVVLRKKDLQNQSKTDSDGLLQKFLDETDFVPAMWMERRRNWRIWAN